MSPEDRAKKLVAAWNYETGAVTDHKAYCKLIDRISEAFTADLKSAKKIDVEVAEAVEVFTAAACREIKERFGEIPEIDFIDDLGVHRQIGDRGIGHGVVTYLIQRGYWVVRK